MTPAKFFFLHRSELGLEQEDQWIEGLVETYFNGVKELHQEKGERRRAKHDTK